MPVQRQRVEFGDFQTPDDLTQQVCSLLEDRIAPRAILEPTCGAGSFLAAALTRFSEACGLGVDINPGYVGQCNERLRTAALDSRGHAIAGDFFSIDWRQTVESLDDPLLIVGNPPWVTNSGLGVMESSNLPAKSNFQMREGFEAKTGKSNFDISEAMLITLLEAVANRPGTVLAVLCKTVVARRLIQHAHSAQLPIADLEVRRFDAKTHFDAAVDACLFALTIAECAGCGECAVFDHLGDAVPQRTTGMRGNVLVSDVRAFDRLADLQGRSPYGWRSGVKHDCSRVMEFSCTGDGCINGFGDIMDLEETFLFPLLKSSELQRGHLPESTRRVIVTQTALNDDTSRIERLAPRTWQYLCAHRQRLDSRRSSIYRSRPLFSMFGVGPYTFAPWKVAISGLYKRLAFTVVGPTNNRPTVLDDTAYFLPCDSESEAVLLCELLNSEDARDFLSSLIFWDSKRPITISVLSQLDILKLAERRGSLETLYANSGIARSAKSPRQPLLVFESP